MADIAGRAVSIAPDVPVSFDQPLAAHHKLIGGWVASQEPSPRSYTCGEARRHIEHVFNHAVLKTLDQVALADFRVVVLHGEAVGPPAVAVICESMGQLDLGWIESSDLPAPWRAAAYAALEQMLGTALPIFSYQDLFEEISMFYWDGETDDDGARACLIACHGADPADLGEHSLPSTMAARKPAWMSSQNAAPLAQLPDVLAKSLRDMSDAHAALRHLPSPLNAWHLDFEILQEYLPGIEECSSLPPLTLVPVEFFAAEVDDVARHGMEYGFMDVAGICSLHSADHIADWFSSLRAGADFLLAAQHLIDIDPDRLRDAYA